MVQAEPELALFTELEWVEGRVARVRPVAFTAYNDASIRKPAPKISVKKNWGADTKGFASEIVPIDTLSVGGPLDRYRLVSFLVRDGVLHDYGEDSPLPGYGLFHDELLEWIADRLNTQADHGPLEHLAGLLTDQPTRAVFGGATTYTAILPMTGFVRATRSSSRSTTLRPLPGGRPGAASSAPARWQSVAAPAGRGRLRHPEAPATTTSAAFLPAQRTAEAYRRGGVRDLVLPLLAPPASRGGRPRTSRRPDRRPQPHPPRSRGDRGLREGTALPEDAHDARLVLVREGLSGEQRRGDEIRVLGVDSEWAMVVGPGRAIAASRSARPPSAVAASISSTGSQV